MKTIVSTEVSFEAAHQLPMMPEGHKCRRLHGHNWKIIIRCTGPVGADGIVIDYYEIEKIWRPLFDQLDHRLLNEVPGLENPTTEVIAAWLWDRFAGLPAPVVLHSLDVFETPHMHCRIEASVGVEIVPLRDK